VIIHDSHVARPVVPPKHDPPLVVDAD
jgi:hypothetical protein